MKKIRIAVILIIGALLIAGASYLKNQIRVLPYMLEENRGDENFIVRNTSIKPILAVLKNGSEKDKMKAIWYLSMFHGERTVEPLLEVVQNKNESVEVRCAAVRALKTYVHPKVSRILNEIKNDRQENEQVRRAATPYSELYPHRY